MAETAVARVSVDELRLAKEQKIGVQITLPLWLARDRDLLSRIMTGHIVAVTAKAILFSGHAITAPAGECGRCHRNIFREESRKVGYGPECCKRLNIPYPKGEITEADRERIWDAIRKITQAEFWVPVSQIDIKLLDHPRPGGGVPAPDVQRIDARFTVSGGTIRVFSQIEHKDKCKAIQGARWNPPLKCWEYAASPTLANQLRAVFSGYRVAADEAFRKLMTAGDQVIVAQEAKLDEHLPPIPVTKTQPWQHQLQGFWFVARMWGMKDDGTVS